MARQKPWEQLPDESESAFSAFQVFLLYEPVTSRTVRNAYRQVSGNPSAIQAPGYFSDWATRFRWSERARLYDMDVARRQYEARMKAIEANERKWAARKEQIAEQDFNDGESLRAKVREMIKAPIYRQTVTREDKSPDGTTIIQHITLEPINFTLAQAGQMLRVASDRQRLAADMATEIVEQVTPDSQAAAKIEEARRVLEEMQHKYPTLSTETLAAKAAAAFGISVDQLLGVTAGANEIIEQYLPVDKAKSVNPIVIKPDGPALLGDGDVTDE